MGAVSSRRRCTRALQRQALKAARGEGRIEPTLHLKLHPETPLSAVADIRGLATRATWQVWIRKDGTRAYGLPVPFDDVRIGDGFRLTPAQVERLAAAAEYFGAVPVPR
jgi:hypothetical protein